VVLDGISLRVPEGTIFALLPQLIPPKAAYSDTASAFSAIRRARSADIVGLELPDLQS
jgi:hypothetical protein